MLCLASEGQTETKRQKLLKSSDLSPAQGRTLTTEDTRTQSELSLKQVIFTGRLRDGQGCNGWHGHAFPSSGTLRFQTCQHELLPRPYTDWSLHERTMSTGDEGMPICQSGPKSCHCRPMPRPLALRAEYTPSQDPSNIHPTTATEGGAGPTLKTRRRLP